MQIGTCSSDICKPVEIEDDPLSMKYNLKTVDFNELHTIEKQDTVRSLVSRCYDLALSSRAKLMGKINNLMTKMIYKKSHTIIISKLK